VNLAGVKVILQLESIGKIRVYDLFDEDDVERYVQGDPEPQAADDPAGEPKARPVAKTSSR
jgi:hypothetical protein